jgi:hypothetical protein
MSARRLRPLGPSGKVTSVRLQVRSPLLTDQVLELVFVDDKTCPHPVA